MRYKALLFPAILCTLLLLCGLAFAGPASSEALVEDVTVVSEPPLAVAGNAENFTVAEDGTIYPIDIPTAEELREHGFPVNQNGETYGGRPWELADELEKPDLVLAQNQNGTVGYIRFSDNPGAGSLEEALNYVGPEFINMYLEDGITIIGRFYISNT